MYGTSIVNTSSSSSADKILKVIGHNLANDDIDSGSQFSSQSGFEVFFSVHITANTYAVGYRNSSAYPCVRVMTYSGAGTPTIGSEYVLSSGDREFVGMYNHPTDTDKFLVCYSNGSNLVYGILTYSGTTVSTNNATTSSYSVGNMVAQQQALMEVPDSASTFIWNYSTGSTTSIRAVHISVSGTTVTETLGSAFSISSWGSTLDSSTSILPLSTTRFLVYGVHEATLQVRLLSVSTATFGSELANVSQALGNGNPGNLAVNMYSPGRVHRGFAFKSGNHAAALIGRRVNETFFLFCGVHWQSSDDTLVLTYGGSLGNYQPNLVGRSTGLYLAGSSPSFIDAPGGKTKNNLVFSTTAGDVTGKITLQLFYCRVPSARATVDSISYPNAGILRSATNLTFPSTSKANGTFVINEDMTYGIFCYSNGPGSTFVQGLDFTTN